MGGKGSGRHCRFDNRLYTEDFRSIDICSGIVNLAT